MTRGLALALLLVSSAVRPSAGSEDGPGVPWRDLDLPAALAAAREEGKTVLVDVWAAWCEPCRRQEEDVWSTAEGAALADGTVPIRVDFDAEAGQAFKRERNVLGLPSVLVLRGDGGEVDRIVGYEEKEAFLAEARALVRGRDPLPELLARLEAAPDDPRLLLDVGARRLQRGAVEEGLALLGRVQSMSPGTAASAEATFLEGRYLHRVLEDPGRALPVWLRLVRGHRDSELRPGGISWALRAHDETDRSDEAWIWIRRLAARDSRDGWAAWFAARYALEHGREPHTALALLERARIDVVPLVGEESVVETEKALSAALAAEAGTDAPAGAGR